MSVIDSIAAQDPKEEFGVTLRGGFALDGDAWCAVTLMPQIWRRSARGAMHAACSGARRLAAAARRAGAEDPDRCAAFSVFMATVMYLTHTNGRRMVRELEREGFKGGSFDLSRLSLVGFDWDVAICRDMLACEDRRVLLDRFAAASTVASNNRRSVEIALLQMPDAQAALLGRFHMTVRDWPASGREAYLLRGLFWQQAEVLGLDFEITDSPMFPRGPRGNKQVRRESWALAGLAVAQA